jgi:ABC-type phosphate transport system substrate-binding protein
LILIAYQPNGLAEDVATHKPTVIAHSNVTLDSVTKNQLRSFFSMRRQEWPDGTAVKVYVLPDRAPLHQTFSKSHIGLFPYQLRKSWDRLVFSGTGEAPTEVNSIEQMIARVAETEGAIGYITKDSVDPRVKTLKVVGDE